MKLHRGRARRAVLALGVVAMALALAGVAGSSPAGAATPTFFLVLGASDSLGVQPSLLTPNGQPTDHGYANYVVASEAQHGISLALTQYGCPGETTNTMINGRDRCYLGGDTQLTEAVNFLHSHLADRGLVTIDIGFNDVHPCLRLGLNSSVCVDHRLVTLRSQLTYILTTLKAAAGPDVTFIGLNHFNPLVAASVGGMRDAATRAACVRGINRMNDALSDIYARFSIAVALTTKAFLQGDTTVVMVPGVGTVTAGVAMVCRLTYMCQPSPLGPNIHPNDAGYQAIADSIMEVLPPDWNTA
jgi:lysophospholipase L1-like esterase